MSQLLQTTADLKSMRRPFFSTGMLQLEGLDKLSNHSLCDETLKRITKY